MRSVSVLEETKVVHNFRIFLSICGICINRDRVWQIYSFFITFFIFSALMNLVYSMYLFLYNLESLAVVIHHSMLTIDVQVSTVFFIVKRNVIRKLISGMCKSYNYDSVLVSDFLDGLQKRRAETMGFAFKCVIFTAVYMQINLILFALVEKYTSNVEFMLLFPCWFPFDLSYLPYHILAYAWEHAITECIGLTIYGVMALIFLVYSHLTSQLKILSYAIEKSKERALEHAHQNQTKDNQGSNFETSLKNSFIKGTKQIAEHHLEIIEYYHNAHGVFRVVYLLVFITGLIVCTCTGFALISDNTSLKIKFVGITIIQLVFLYVVCWFGEKIADMSENIRLSIYEVEWYEMPKECQSTLRLMVERTLKPLGFSTLTGQKVDLDNYMSMIKASYSYFNMMLATQEKN